ncbi:MAG TPA: hypothetical protein VN461_17370 [Vicinamibacteria bacterium]|jgi:hypothetical protein|nr:hypothetical protein [Vicinamibacteria bacterium]
MLEGAVEMPFCFCELAEEHLAMGSRVDIVEADADTPTASPMPD